MIFRPGRFYRHRRMIDVIFRVLQTAEQEPDAVLNVCWYNMRRGFPLGDIDMIVVRAADKPDYREVAWS